MALICVDFFLQIVSHYRKNTPVFAAFLNACKAFDRTNRNLSLAKLIKRKILMCIVILLVSSTSEVGHLLFKPLHGNQRGETKASSHSAGLGQGNMRCRKDGC